MPRDDLSIDFVRKMPPPESSLDPAIILDEWINRTQNLPEEIRFLQDEVADKDRQYDKLVREIEDRDGRIQKWIKAHGSHQVNPKEAEYRALIRKNFSEAERLSSEKLALTQKLQQTMDKHIRQLDIQLKLLYDRAEPGFTDPDEIPSLLRPSAANSTSNIPPVRSPAGALNNLPNGASQSAARAANSQIRNTQAQQHGSASAPASPAANMILNRQAREGSAGPPKRGPRLNTSLSNIPTTSSGLARHASLGPGTPKGHTTATGAQRAGSAGPRASSKASGSGASRKAGTPSSTSGSRKKGAPAAGSGANKSGLSRVKRAAKNSPSSNADSELSDAESASADESDAGRATGRATPAGLNSRSSSNLGSGGGGGNNGPNSSSNGPNHPNHPDGSEPSGGNASGSHGDRPPHHHHNGPPRPHHNRDDDDAMDLDDDEAGDDKKYCSCQNVSFGNMVACDNDDCPYEWFHWGCVGLKSEPNGAWFCPDCSESMKKKAGVPGATNGGGGGGSGGNTSTGVRAGGGGGAGGS
ncbi:inhibitor of growth proteins N-terminal histone-binding-domain-containing protein [Podospora australis]|uniref:Chromatin modification-related protein n=1 Tax=Podospora australis TaxID=1536484 RepID=A0AAN6WUF6_9PEZI|nr:inhibitor of growth proteins N-terminal histone-binding-domain-containing protein [Podospora australis]